VAAPFWHPGRLGWRAVTRTSADTSPEPGARRACSDPAQRRHGFRASPPPGCYLGVLAACPRSGLVFSTALCLWTASLSPNLICRRPAVARPSAAPWPGLAAPRPRTAGVLAVARPSAALWLGLPDSDYMPGSSVGAPTGDADADPVCWRPRSGSAQRCTVARTAGLGLLAGLLRAHIPVTSTRTQTAGDLAVARPTGPSTALWLGPPDSDYMPGRTAGAPTGDAGAAPEFWPARNGSASVALWIGPSARMGSHGG
jgi:hypothetical protein